MDNENTTPTEDKDKKPTTSEETPKAETAAETPSEATEEQAEGTTPETAGEAAESEPEPSEETPETAPEADETLEAKVERLEAENAALKAREEARNAGFRNEYVEDAVIIAEHAAKRDGITIQEALQAVAKKYPDWKNAPGGNGKSGFKVGAEAPKDDNAAENEKLDEAFGIRRKK